MMLRLKTVDMREHNLTVAAKEWKDRGEIVSLGYPSLNGKWVKVCDDERKWSGWIYLYELIALASSKLAGMALTENTERLILNWLSLTERPFSIAIPEVGFEKIIITDVVEDGPLNKSIMLQIRTQNLSVWVEKLNFQPETTSYDISFFQGIGWPVQFTIGSTMVRFQTFKRIECGDILLIKNISTEVRCFNCDLFPYEWSYKIMITEETQLPETVSEIEPLYDMSQLPVQLEFVMYRCVLKLDDIQALYKNKIYPFPQGIENDIEIQVNGSLIGRGVLRQLDDKLGVEITTWLKESQSDE
ncbi:YscQ/HrcQ family type III secretion apparatus protein [Yersinia enterocolitica]|uniref:YscQ/HrcQ family type III secretion apparatus protein n=1 Tax=Yersinia enterocolitica TaxID=630 RepID=UPI00398CB0AA